MPTLSLPGYDAWKLGLNIADPTEYDYDSYEGLPYKWDVNLRRYRDPETGEFVKTAMAEQANDDECERQDEIDRQREDDLWREDY